MADTTPHRGTTIRSATWVALIALTVSYLYAAILEYSDTIFEASLLHFLFLEDFVSGNASPASFFTTFGEHLIPGYNLILMLNYYLFRIWGGLDNIIFVIGTLVMSVLVGYTLYWRLDSWRNAISGWQAVSCVFTLAVVMSLTHNAMWGMALAAHLGVVLLVVCALLLERAYFVKHPKVPVVLLVLVPINLLIFLGGYGAGFLGAVLVGAFALGVRHPKARASIAVLAVVITATVIAYLFLVTREHSLLSEVPRAPVNRLVDTLLFAIIMTGASLLGNATYEAYQSLVPYYVVGGTLMVAALASALFLARRTFTRTLQTGDVFILVLLAYSLATILMVSIMRVGNGLGGAMGNWYNSHTMFLPIAVAYLAFGLIDRHAPGRQATVAAGLASLVLLISLSGLVTGDYINWRKAPAIATWKDGYRAQAPQFLNGGPPPDQRQDAQHTMLWGYEQTKAAVEFMYRENLWMFRRLPTWTGRTADGWLTADADLTIICPAGTSSAHFSLYRPEDWAPSTIVVALDDQQSELPVTNGEQTVRFDDSAILRLTGRDAATSQPVRSAPDTRPLIAIVGDPTCS